MTANEFADLVAPITGWIGDHALDGALEVDLNRSFPADGALFQSVVPAAPALQPDGCAIAKAGG